MSFVKNILATFLFCGISFWGSAQLTRTMNEIDKIRGYLEIRIGKKYNPIKVEEANQNVTHETRPGIVNYSYFFGIPIMTLKVEQDAKKRVSKIEFVFDHKNEWSNHQKNVDDLLVLLGKPSHIKKDSDEQFERVCYWMGRKVNVVSTELLKTELQPNMLSLYIEGK
ncbi:MAG: hypothetical protein MI810_22460 [Flavobacteriales bacterium]|jgi:hypothetical protein|nr:hypothetical protein [Flavobacteriales bacterium]